LFNYELLYNGNGIAGFRLRLDRKKRKAPFGSPFTVSMHKEKKIAVRKEDKNLTL